MLVGLRRLFAGGRASIQGTIAELFSYYFKREMVAGPPKQFAALCGIMFSGLATLFLFLGGEGEYGAGDGEGFFITGQVALDETEEALAEERSWPIGSVVFSWLCDVRTPVLPHLASDDSSIWTHQ